MIDDSVTDKTCFLLLVKLWVLLKELIVILSLPGICLAYKYIFSWWFIHIVFTLYFDWECPPYSGVHSLRNSAAFLFSHRRHNKHSMHELNNLHYRITWLCDICLYIFYRSTFRGCICMQIHCWHVGWLTEINISRVGMSHFYSSL